MTAMGCECQSPPDTQSDTLADGRGRKCWTLTDEIIQQIVHSRPPTSITFALLTVRNQQVEGSSPFAGSSFSEHIRGL